LSNNIFQTSVPFIDTVTNEVLRQSRPLIKIVVPMTLSTTTTMADKHGETNTENNSRKQQILSTEASFYVCDRWPTDINVIDGICTLNLRIKF